MEHKIIKIENYLLVVSDEEIKVGDWLFANQGVCKIVEIKEGNYPYGSINNRGDKVFDSKHWKTKIIAHRPLNGAPYLDGVDVLPDFEEIAKDDINKLAWQYGITFGHHPDMFLMGYNKAKETYKYTEEDIKSAMRIVFDWSEEDGHEECTSLNELFDKFKSLNQPKLPIAFECEMKVITESTFKKADSDEIEIFEHKVPKTITNSEGRTEWVGTYIF